MGNKHERYDEAHALLAQGKTCREIATQLGIKIRTVRSWQARRRETMRETPELTDLQLMAVSTPWV